MSSWNDPCTQTSPAKHLTNPKVKFKINPCSQSPGTARDNSWFSLRGLVKTFFSSFFFLNSPENSNVVYSNGHTFDFVARKFM